MVGLALLPQPQSVVLRDGRLTLPADATLGGDADLAAIVRRILEPGTGLALPGASSGLLTVRLDDSLAAEHYTLAVTTDGVALSAADPAGMNWAAQTLRQLLGPAAFALAPVTDRWTLPCVTISDGPRFAWRGSHLDTSRFLTSSANLFHHVDMLAMHKYNVFHLHLTDDQGWRFESKRYPRLTEVGAWRRETVTPAYGGDGTPHGGYYRQDHLRALVRYAADRGVTVVPEIEFPGHVSAVLAAYPDLAVPGHRVDGTATGFGIIDDVLAISDDAMAFVFGVWDEVLDIFPSRYVHIGGDECPTLQWEGNAAMEAKAAELGLAGASELQGWFTRQVRDWLAERGRVAVGWDEICEAGPVDGMVCAAWRSPEYGQRAAQAGMDVLMAPLTSTYFDYYPSERPDEPYRIGGLASTHDAYAWDPCDGVDDAVRHHILGTQCQLWTEYLPTYPDIEYTLWPRACAHAEVAWTARDLRSWDDFAARLPTHLARLDARGVNYRPESGPLPWQQGGSGTRRRPGNQEW